MNKEPTRKKPTFELLTSESDAEPDGPINDVIELTVRTSLKQETKGHLLCSLLRSASVFWNGSLGDVVIILDEEEKFDVFESKLKSLGLPFNFRFVYEDAPRNVESFERIAREFDRSYGYMRMLYSSFLMDKYTTASILAWVDTDTVFTFPVTNASIFRDGKLIVKGMNTLRKHSYVNRWNHSTYRTLGLPMVSDFMSYFPIYVYRSTIRNCRQFILQRLGTRDFEKAYFKMAFTVISPVNIIMSYAYYFERDKYDWHIDLGVHSLSKYNALNLPEKYPVSIGETILEPHTSIHKRYYQAEIDPLQQAICYVQFAIGMTNISHCRMFEGKVNLQLFEFQTEPVANHLDSWCRPRLRDKCYDVIDKWYRGLAHLYRKREWTLDTSYIQTIEDFAFDNYQLQCSVVTYQLVS